VAIRQADWLARQCYTCDKIYIVHTPSDKHEEKARTHIHSRPPAERSHSQSICRARYSNERFGENVRDRLLETQWVSPLTQGKTLKYMCGDISLMGMSCDARIGFLHFSGLRYSPGVELPDTFCQRFASHSLSLFRCSMFLRLGTKNNGTNITTR